MILLKEVETFITEERERMSSPEKDDEPDPPQKPDSKESDDVPKLNLQAVSPPPDETIKDSPNPKTEEKKPKDAKK